MSQEDGDEADGALTRRTFGGLQWTYLQTIVSSILQLVVAAVLARLLDPADFGLVALATLTLRFVNYLARGGITQAVIQKPDLTEEDVRAGFTASVVLGAVFFGVVLLGAPVASELLNTPELVPVLRWMGLQMFLFSLGATADGLLRRRLQFRAIAIRGILSYVVGYAGVALVLSAMGAGIWALVAGALTQTGLWSLMAYVAAPHRVLPTLSREAHRSILAFGSRVSLISFMEFLGMELDTLAVGRYAGAASVGLYNRAYLLVKLPLQQATTSLSSVLFPAFANLQSDLDRVRRGYLGALRLVSAFVVPAAVGMAVAREELVLTVLGEDWVGATVVVPWIAASASLNLLTHLAGVLAEAKGRLNPKLVITFLKVLTLIAMLAVAADRQLEWFAIALATADLFSHVCYTWLASRIVKVPLRTVLAAYLPAVVAGALVGAAIAVARIPLEAAALPVAVRLLVEIAVAALVLVAALRFGPVRSARDEALNRLALAGLDASSRGGAALHRILGHPRGGRAGPRR